MLTKNEALNVPRCLASVPAGSPVLVVDAESVDETVAVARARGARVVVRAWQGFVTTRRFALSQTETPWTFMLDADEALDGDLAHAIERVDPPDDVDAYAVRRATYVCGKPMRYGAWGADSPLRLFRTARARLLAQPAAGGSAELHERWTVPGRVDALPGVLLHDSYPSLAVYGKKFAAYTTLEARGLRASGAAFARALGVAVLRAGWLLAVRGGWRDGWRGAFVALASAAYPAVVVWKAWRR